MGQLCSVPGIPQHQIKSVSSNYLDRKTNILGKLNSDKNSYYTWKSFQCI